MKACEHIIRNCPYPNLLVLSIYLLLSCSFRPNNTRLKEIKESYGGGEWKIYSSQRFSDTIKPSSNGDFYAWWTIFNDPILDSLEDLAVSSNPDIRNAIARLDEARANIKLSASDLFPAIRFSPSATRNQLSQNRPNPFQASGNQLPGTIINTFQLPLAFDYEIDLWGKYRNNVQAERYGYASSSADMNGVLLSITTDVAYYYVLVRITDIKIDIYTKALQTRKDNLILTEERYRVGLITLLDLSQAQTDYQTIQSQFYDLQNYRNAAEHALAMLCGVPAYSFSLSKKNWSIQLPHIPEGIPSDLLKRRPDIQSQEQIAEAANASIGVYKAYKFPSLMLTGSAGTLSRDVNTLLSSESKTWLLGATLSLPIFMGGRNTALIQIAKARYLQTTAQYERVVLASFREVEDALNTLAQRKEQSILQDSIIKTTELTAMLSRERYSKGLVTYYEVVNNERTALNAQSIAAQIRGDQFTYTIYLIKALGGSWR
ncbi:MAG: efflux transporter outer membrane subunit [Sporocytophaga sp.]|uniref:efflux transporter outer membrane subunit n=1 Tax=Sporocytophaga sp. TaxID=2231183 RepID=UPI001B253FAA|nr:efflux transporter outer membrane subunit [Sporocytophaga sp.]MBO9699497.1 efflux transporter outer membrane subunit [Sporocytophaga sp.]